MAAKDFQASGENSRKRYSPGGYSYQHQLMAVGCDFQHLGGKAIQGSCKLIAGENDQAVHADPPLSRHLKRA
jgi:hypothetical protein